MPHLAGHWVIRARLQYIQWHLRRGGLLSLARSPVARPSFRSDLHLKIGTGCEAINA